MVEVTLREAIANVQGLRNLFRGLEKVEATLQAAQVAENLAGERQKLIDAKTAELATIAAGVDAAKTAEAERAQAAEKSHALRLAEQQAQFDAIALSFSSIKAKLQADLTEAQADYDTKTTKLLDEIRDLTVIRDGLVVARDDLAGQLAQLKDRAANL